LPHVSTKAKGFQGGKMRRGHLHLIGAAVFVFCLMLAASATAQQGSGIAGVVRDDSGAVLPGVTVEAASPALIEKTPTAQANTRS
jgi:hypothetical protein